MKKIRVLVVDDSALMRKLIPQMLAADESIEVVGTAMDGSFCLKKIEELKPNVVTLDLEMPGMNGIDTLKEIMRRQPVPVIVFSSHSTEGATVTMKALGLGAFDFVPKPKDPSAHMAEVGARTDREGQGGGRLQAEAADADGIPPKPQKSARAVGSSQQDRRHRSLDRRSAGARIRALAIAGRLPCRDCGRATHAGGIHRHVRAASG